MCEEIIKTGTVYKLIFKNTGQFYYGSTTQKLKSRLKGHKQSLKIGTLIQKIGIENVEMIPIEIIEVNNIKELYKIEDKYIKENLNNKLCLNSNRAFMTPNEYNQYHKNYREVNAKYHKEWCKNYRLENLERIRDYDNERYKTEHRKEQKRESNRQCYARLKEENSEKYQEQLKIKRDKKRERLHKMKEEEPEAYQEYLKKQREAAAKRKQAKKTLENL